MNAQHIWNILLATITGCMSINSTAGQYNGAWFQIWHPDNFEIIPSIASKTAEQGFDSVFFRSSDGQVEFYIFAPQWAGEPIDILIDPSLEILRVKNSKRSGDNDEITWFTIEAKDGSYSRSYQDTVSNSGSTRWVLGIKYANQAAYNLHKSNYLKFKNSLELFAD